MVERPRSLLDVCRRASFPLIWQMQGFRSYHLLDGGPNLLIIIIIGRF